MGEKRKAGNVEGKFIFLARYMEIILHLTMKKSVIYLFAIPL